MVLKVTCPLYLMIFGSFIVNLYVSIMNYLLKKQDLLALPGMIEFAIYKTLQTWVMNTIIFLNAHF